MRDFLVAEEDVKDHDAVAARIFATDEYDPIEYFDHLSEDELFDEFIRRQDAYLRLTQYLESVRADKLKARLADHYKLKTLE